MTDHGAALSAIRDCAMEMLSNAQYIEAELPNVALPPDLRARTEEAASSLVGTKHDVISEIFDFCELRDSGGAESDLNDRLARMIRWLGEDASKLHELVEALRAAYASDPNLGGAYVLVMESATNILRSYGRACEAVKAR